MSLNRLMLFLFAACLALPAKAALPRTLHACGDAAEFPPYQYFKRESGRVSRQPVGFDIDVLRNIMAAAGHDIDFDMLPWTRCLALAERGEYDLAMDGVKSPERERVFLFATPHYAITPVFIYRKNGPKPAMGSAAALATERLCAQAGYNYAPFGVPDKAIHNRVRTLEDAAKILKLGRCTVMIQQLEVLRANVSLGGVDYLNDRSLGFEFPTWMPQMPFSFIVSRTLPHRFELLSLLDQGLLRLRKSGELSKMRNVYFQNVPPVQVQ